MLNFKDYLIENNINIPDELFSYLNEVTPDDVGEESFENYILKFEGFNQECWYGATNDNKTIESLEKEILNDWKKTGKLVKYGWKDDVEFGVDNVFYGIYLSKGI